MVAEFSDRYEIAMSK